MKATIWHNPNCSKSRAALETLQARDDVELEVVQYLKHPPSRDKLAQLYRDAGMTPQQGLRLRGTDAEARNLAAAITATNTTVRIAPRMPERTPFSMIAADVPSARTSALTIIPTTIEITK